MRQYESKGVNIGFDSGKSADENENLSNRGLIISPSMPSTGKTESTTKSAVADGTIIVRDTENQKQDINDLNRDTKGTLNKLDKIFDKEEIEERDEKTGLFAELAFTAVHQLSTDKNGNSRWTPTERAMIHAAIGYLTADLAGSETPISTALANGVNAYAVEAIKKDEKLKAYFDDNPALLRMVSIGIGAGIGGLTGDGNADAWSGASSAQNATRWNDQGLDAETAAQQGKNKDEVIAENDRIYPQVNVEEQKHIDTTDEQRGGSVNKSYSNGKRRCNACL